MLLFLPFLHLFTIFASYLHTHCDFIKFHFHPLKKTNLNLSEKIYVFHLQNFLHQFQIFCCGQALIYSIRVPNIILLTKAIILYNFGIALLVIFSIFFELRSVALEFLARTTRHFILHHVPVLVYTILMVVNNSVQQLIEHIELILVY